MKVDCCKKMQNTKTVSIIGAGHSGSTLLDLVLGKHSSIFSVGEISSWDRYIEEKKECTCGLPIESCEFWKPIVAQLEDSFATSDSHVKYVDTRSPTMRGALNRLRYRTCLLLVLLFPMHKYRNFMDRISPELKHRIINNINLFELIRESSGKPIVCDSSKSAFKFRLLYAREPETAKAIFLTRDGRAVAASHHTRYGKSINRGAMRWLFTNKYTEYMLRTLPDHAFIHVRYEELCRDPEATLNRIYQFIGCPFDPNVLQFNDNEIKHNISGNRMRMNGLSEIKEDLKWRERLTEEQIKTFNKLAGKTNRKLLGSHMVV